MPLIEGLKFEWVEVDSYLEIPDKEVFNTILGISKMVDKFDIVPDSVEFSDEKGIILHYNKARIYLGEDENLEEKLTHLEAILPNIRNLTGILHMEEFSNDTVNIVFTKDNGTDPADEKEETPPEEPGEGEKPGSNEPGSNEPGEEEPKEEEPKEEESKEEKPKEEKPKDEKPKDEKPGNAGTTNPPDEWEA